mgnify:CR=1 FL=1
MCQIIDTYVKIEAIGDSVDYVGYVISNNDDEMTVLAYRTDIFTPYAQLVTFKHSSIWGSAVLHQPKKGLKFTFSEILPSTYFDIIVKKVAHQAIVEGI